jgi:hypothetical protein
MGSLRDLKRAHRNRFEVFRHVAGGLVCLDWGSVPAENLGDADDNSKIFRVPGTEEYFKGFDEIPKEYNRAGYCNWRFNGWCRLDEVENMKRMFCDG